MPEAVQKARQETGLVIPKELDQEAEVQRLITVLAKPMRKRSDRGVEQKTKARLLRPRLGRDARSVKALLRAKFENSFEEMLDVVGDSISKR